jgi:N-acetylated-alpha-linked acidic dipeptidase
MHEESFVDLIKDLPSSQSIHEFFEHYASYSQLAGSNTDLKLAKWTRDKFTDFGLTNATIETYYPYLNYPIRRELAIISGPQELLYEADLTEPKDTTPAFHGNYFGHIVICY